MLELGHQDFVPRAHMLPPEALRDQVDCFGRPTDKNDLARIARAKEARDLGPSRLERMRRLGTQRVNDAMNVCRGLVRAPRGVDACYAILCRARAVEVDDT